MEIVRTLKRSIRRKPLLTDCVSSFILTYLSDMICQYIEKPKDKSYIECYNTRRSCNLTFFRVSCITPVLHYWYKYLHKIWPSRNLAAIFAKSVFDRLTVGSATVLSFFVSQHYLNGGNTPDLVKKIENDLPRALKMNVMFWTAGLMVNFKLVPHSFQVLFVNKIAFFWMIYLSMTMNNEKKHEKDHLIATLSTQYKENVVQTITRI